MGIVQEVFIGERLEECFEVTALLRSEREPCNEGRLIRVLAAVARVWAFRNNPASVDVVIEHSVKAMETAVMHIRRTNGYIAQRRRAEFADVGWVVGELVNSKVVGGVGEFSGEVVETVVLKFNAVSTVRCLIDGFAAEGEPAVASGTTQRGMEKKGPRHAWQML